MRVYLVLLGVCVGLIIYGTSQASTGTRLLDFGMDSFKFVLGAVIGSLSMAATAHWGKPTNANDQH